MTAMTMRTAIRLGAILLLLGTLGSGCRWRGGTYDFVWLHGGAPVSGVEVTLADARGRTLASGPLQDGTIRTPQPAASVRVVDPVHGGVVLLEQPLAGSGSIRVPEAIRLRLRVEGARSDTVVRIGSGPRAAPAERYAGEHGKQWMRHESDREAFGIALPPSASRWEGAERTAQELFNSGWIAAAAAPQIVAVDAAASLTAVTEVPLPAAIAHGATVDGGTIRLQPSRTIDLEVAIPNGELPPAVMITLSDPSIDAARRDEAGRAISVLDQIDRRVFEHLILRAPIFLPHSGRLHLAGLPFDAVTIGVLDTDRGGRASRTVRLDGGAPATVSVAATDLVGLRGPRRALGGQVVTADRQPLASARVVLSDVPERFETTTDAQGHFAFPSVLADRPVTLFVEPPALAAAASPPRIFRGVDPSEPITLALPRSAGPLPRPAAVGLACGRNDPTSNDQYPSIAGQLNGQWTEATILAANWDTKEFLIRTDAEGPWTFFEYDTPFVGYFSQPTLLRAHTQTWIRVDQPFDNTRDQIVFLFFRPNHAPAGDTTITFPSLLPDPDPIELTTNTQGLLTLNCVNASPLAVFVRTPAGNLCFDGDVNLTVPVTNVTLQQCPQEPQP